MNPSKFSGYTTWNPLPNAASYRLNILEKDNNNNFTVISTRNFTENFCKINPLLFTIPNMHYEIIALSSTQTVIQTTGPVPAVPPGGGGLGTQFNCTRKCNGTSYAYGLSEKQNILSMTVTGVDTVYTYANKQLVANPTHMSYNSTTGFYVPYWQAISKPVWDAIPGGHPYNLWDGANQLYEKHIISMGGNVPLAAGVVGPFWDAGGNVISVGPNGGGMLVEKKMDQYDRFNGAETPVTAAGPEEFCWGPTYNNLSSLFTNFFNTYDNAPMPLSAQPFSSTVPLNLLCFPALNGGVAPGPPNPYDPQEQQLDTWDLYLDGIWEELNGDLVHPISAGGGGYHPPVINPIGTGGSPTTHHDLLAILNEVNSKPDPDNEYLRAIQITSILNEDVSYFYIYDSGRNTFVLRNAIGTMNPGIYKIMLFTSRTDIIAPMILNLSNVIPRPEIKESVEMLLYPNPIQNDKVVFDLTSDMNANAQLILHDLNGVVLYTETLSLDYSQPITKSIPVSSNPVPYNQIKISIVFSDGSILQETALKL